MSLSPHESDLTSPQEELLLQIVEWEKKGADDLQQRGFWFVSTYKGSYVHPHARDAPEIPANRMDLLALRDAGYIILQQGAGESSESGGSGGLKGKAHRFFETHRSRAPAVETIFEEKRLFVTKALKEDFPNIAKVLAAAEQELWEANNEQDWSRVGHDCRLAIQDFAEALHLKYLPKVQRLPAEKTIDKIRAVLGDNPFSKTRLELCNSLLGYWGATIDLVEKVEHRSQRDASPLTWDDAKRCVFHTYVVMEEILRFLDRQYEVR